MDYDDEEREIKKQQRAELAAGKDITVHDLEPFKMPEILGIIDYIHDAITDFKVSLLFVLIFSASTESTKNLPSLMPKKIVKNLFFLFYFHQVGFVMTVVFLGSFFKAMYL